MTADHTAFPFNFLTFSVETPSWLPLLSNPFLEVGPFFALGSFFFFYFPLTNMMGLFGSRKTPQEMLRENQRMITRSVRELDRERTKLEAQEKKIIVDIKKAAKAGQMVCHLTLFSSPFTFFLADGGIGCCLDLFRVQ